MQMQALYYVSLPCGNDDGIDRQDYESDIKANENCLNQNFKLIAMELAELRELIEVVLQSQ